MSYIELINAFERWLENNYLPTQSQLLFYKFLVIFNRSAWAEWVSVDNLRLMTLTQISNESTLIRHRDNLVREGLIEYQKGKKGSPNKYKINTSILKVKTQVETTVKMEVFPQVKTTVEMTDINRQRERERIKKDISNEISKKERPPYEEITDLYNQICTELPSCINLSESRKKAIRARLASGYTVDDFKTLFQKTKDSSFLTGGNNRNWIANFDWLIKDNNMAKVLEGNYDNRESRQEKPNDYSFDLEEYERSHKYAVPELAEEK